MKITENFAKHLRSEGKSAGTVEKYTRDVGNMLRWLGERELTQAAAQEWQEYLLRERSSRTVNAMLAALNAYCAYKALPIRLGYLKVQRRLFRESERELARDELQKLMDAAGEEGTYALIINTLFSCGIRVSELRYITAEAIERGKAVVRLKAKERVILIPEKLCRELRAYAQKRNIRSGSIFLDGNGRCITRFKVWAEMKKAAKKAGVSLKKVFPHNLRHLFAREVYAATGDIAMLAGLLGHSSIETTRIYLMTTDEEHRKALEKLALVS